MIRRAITRTPLSTEDANAAFPRIEGCSFCDGDETFVSTFRALLWNVEGAEVHISKNQIDPVRADVGDIVRRLPKNSIKIIEVFGSSASEFIKGANEWFCNDNQGYERTPNFAQYCERVVDVDCFRNLETMTSVVLVTRLSVRALHFMQSAAFAMVPWYKGRIEDVKEKIEFCSLLRKASPDGKVTYSEDEAISRYNSYLQTIADKLDLKKIRTRRLLAGIEKAQYEKKLNIMRREKRELEENIKSYFDSIRRMIKEKSDVEEKILGIELKKGEQEENLLLSFFENNKAVDLISVYDTEIRFVAKGYCIVDPDVAERVLENEDSSFYDRHNDSISLETMIKILKRIFVDGEWKLRICAAFNLGLNEYLNGITGFEFGDEYDTYLHNPHLDIYNCFDAYRSTAMEAISTGDNITPVEVAIMSACTMNLNDSTVMEHLLRGFYGAGGRLGQQNPRCIELPDGVVINFTEAAKMIEEEA